MVCRVARGVLVSMVAVGVAATQQPVPAHVETFVQEHCITCYGEDKVKGELDLTTAPKDAVARLWRWSRMRERVVSVEMPPEHVSEVSGDERAQFVGWVENLLRDEVPRLPADPGRVTVRRLTREHWQNVVRDAFGVDVSADGFPADDLGYGFDSIGDALSVSTLHLEKYLQAAQEVAQQVFHGEDADHPEARRYEAESMTLVDDRGAGVSGDFLNMYARSTTEQSVVLPRDGRYRLRVVAKAQQAGDEPAKMRLESDRVEVQTFDVPNARMQEFVIERQMRAGSHVFSLSFTNDYYAPKNPDRSRRDRNLHIDSFEVIGPVDPRPVPAVQQWLHDAAKGRTEIAQLRNQIAVLLDTVWRRRARKSEQQRLQRAAVERLRAGEPLVSVQRFALAVALTSPNFLFRVESPNKPVDGSAMPLEAVQLASRLSFFLWASAPDEELLRAAADGALRRAKALVAQVDRMLADPRASRLATDFAAQWWELRTLADRAPDPELFPSFDTALRRSFQRESELLFDAVLREQRDVRELLDCDFTHVDARLARFYGLPHDGAPGAFERVALTGDARLRGGLLGHGSMHLVTSNPTRTSPVKRGKWILDNLLGQAPPPPAPGSDSFENEEAIDSTASLRVQLAKHRESSRCAVCHVRMDTLGFAMERFDAIGAYRKRDAAGEIDASGDLPDGTHLDGVADLKRLLVADPTFVRTVAHKLFVYAIGRDLRPVDRLRVDLAIEQLMAQPKVTLRDLIMLVVRDVAFTSTSPE